MAAAIGKAAGQSNPPSYYFYSFGQGERSCANWLSRPEWERDGGQWIFGYWSATNYLNKNNHLVGSHTDAEAILAETKKICHAEPSTNLYQAVGRVYAEFQRTGK